MRDTNKLSIMIKSILIQLHLFIFLDVLVYEYMLLDLLLSLWIEKNALGSYGLIAGDPLI